MTTKQMAKTPSEMLHNLPPSPIRPMKTASVIGTLTSHALAGEPPTIIKSTGEDWKRFRPYVNKDGKSTSTHDSIFSGACPQSLDIVRVDNNQLCFDDLASALPAVDAAQGKGLVFLNTVTTHVLHLPDPPDPKEADYPPVKCADVVWYRYANTVELRGDEALVPSRVATGYATPPASPTKWYEYKVFGLWLRYTFRYVMPEFSFVYGLNVPDNPDMLNPTASASLEIWLGTGEVGKLDGVGVGVEQSTGPNGWVAWESSDLATTLTLASELRKHLWDAKGNHVFVRVDDEHKNRISQILIPS